MHVFALQPLGRKLDRGQRVLDLMGDAARHIGPGGGALGGDQIGDVVEGDDKASFCRASLATCTLRVRALPARLTVTSPLGAAHRLEHGAPDQRRQFRHRFGIMLALHIFRRGVQQPRGGAVDDGDPSFASRPITPALTPASTVSVKRRRSSIWRLAATRSPRCASSC